MISIKEIQAKDAESLALLARVSYGESHAQFIKEETDLKAYCDEAFSVEQMSKSIQSKQCLLYFLIKDNLPIGYAKIDR